MSMPFLHLLFLKLWDSSEFRFDGTAAFFPLYALSLSIFFFYWCFLFLLCFLLFIQAEQKDDSVQLKVLQTLLLVVSSHSIAVLSEDALTQALSTCLRLHSPKNSNIIFNTATATLRQVLYLILIAVLSAFLAVKHVSHDRQHRQNQKEEGKDGMRQCMASVRHFHGLIHDLIV